jgi:hypothetical protein
LPLVITFWSLNHQLPVSRTAPNEAAQSQDVKVNREPIASIQDACKTMHLYQAIYDAALEGKEGTLDYRPLS